MLILFLLLLLVETVEAETLGEKAITKASNNWVPCSQLYGPADMECRMKGDRIEVRKWGTSSCEERMQAAMGLMDMFLRTSGVLPEDKKHVFETWEQTMEDCVK